MVSTDGCYFSKTVFASAVGKSLMNTIRQHFIMNFIQKWSVEKISLLKIFQKKGGVLYIFSFFLPSISIFKCYFTVKNKDVEESVHTCPVQ